jgi:hypothetical protein
LVSNKQAETIDVTADPKEKYKNALRDKVSD